MNELIKAAVATKQISRLCHFTPSRNLQHIAAGKSGVLSTSTLANAERACYNPTDLQRLDQKTTHICCSIEYPNAWYFENARKKDPLFPDWVVLLVDPKYLHYDSTLFCPRNAAAEYGRHITTGFGGFEAMYAPRVVGTRNTPFIRSNSHISACPTDQQAEVLIADRIIPEDILGVAVVDEGQARTERVRLRTNGLDPDLFQFIIAPHMFDKYRLNRAITTGARPPEHAYTPPTAT